MAFKLLFQVAALVFLQSVSASSTEDGPYLRSLLRGSAPSQGQRKLQTIPTASPTFNPTYLTFEPTTTYAPTITAAPTGTAYPTTLMPTTKTDDTDPNTNTDTTTVVTNPDTGGGTGPIGGPIGGPVNIGPLPGIPDSNTDVTNPDTGGGTGPLPGIPGSTTDPTASPTPVPTAVPTKKPTQTPTKEGETLSPTAFPTKSPTALPTKSPTPGPTVKGFTPSPTAKVVEEITITVPDPVDEDTEGGSTGSESGADTVDEDTGGADTGETDAGGEDDETRVGDENEGDEEAGDAGGDANGDAGLGDQSSIITTSTPAPTPIATGKINPLNNGGNIFAQLQWLFAFLGRQNNSVPRTPPASTPERPLPSKSIFRFQGQGRNGSAGRVVVTELYV